MTYKEFNAKCETAAVSVMRIARNGVFNIS